MRVSVVAALIVGVHVAVIGSVVMTQGCASTRRGAASTVPATVEPAPVPILPPSATATPPPALQPVAFPPIQPPTEPAPLPTSVAAENVYVVKSGDSLSKIAAAHGVGTRELAELNQVANANKIRVGQKLVLPDHAKPSQSQPAAKSAAAPKVVAGAGEYVVKSGDALSKIAAAHGVKTKDLMAANNIADPNKIRAGQKLTIPGAKAAEKKEAAPKAEEPAAVAPAPAPAEKPAEPAVAPLPPPVPEPAPVAAVVPPAAPAAGQEGLLDYTVQAGDTAESIARLFVVSKDEILRINNVPAGSEVSAGQKIKIPPSSP